MMLRVLAVSTLAVSLFASVSSAEEKAVWLRDLDAAKTEAKSSHKDILIRVHWQGVVLPRLSWSVKS